MRSTPFFLLASLVAACATDKPGPGDSTIQMNDLSVLLPLPRTETELAAALAPTAQAKGGVLFPEAVFKQDQRETTDYAALRAVAFRLDPCFGTTDPAGHPEKCENQLRIVFQPIRGNGIPQAEDSAVHAFYKLTREELLAAVQEVADARLADAGAADLGPLAVHPTIAAEGLDGNLAQAFDHILTKYAGEQNLVRFTTFVFLAFDAADGPAIGQDWGMHALSVANGQATDLQIGGAPASSFEVSLGVFSNPLSTRATPGTTTPDDIALLTNFDQAMSATQAERQHALDAAFKIENPTKHTPDTIDCASCHMTQPGRDLVAQKLGMQVDGNPNAFVPAGIPAADLGHTTNIIGTDGGLNIHAFSYRFTEPMINQRVINETAANLALIRQLTGLD
jgi:hypothetical protein